MPKRHFRLKTVVPIKNYTPVYHPKKRMTLRELVRKREREIRWLERNLRILKDAIRRKNEAIEQTIELFEDGLNEEEWPGYEAVRRFLSRQRGAKDYRGAAD